MLASIVSAEIICDEKRGIATDTESNLIWQDDIHVLTSRNNWQGAIDYCEKLSLAGYNDWTLPNVEILRALYNKKTYLKQQASYYHSFWAGSIDNTRDGNAFYVNFADEGIGSAGTDSNYFVRCVRSNTGANIR